PGEAISTTLTGLDLKLPPDAHLRLATLDAWKQSLHSTGQNYARAVQEAIRPLLGAVGLFDASWQLLCQEVLAGKILDMPRVREAFLDAFKEHLRFLRVAQGLARFAERIAESGLPEAKQLDAEAEVLGQKLTKLAARWRTAEDLEDLAAESIEL